MPEQFVKIKHIVYDKVMMQGDILLLEVFILIVIVLVHVIRHWNK